MSAPLYEELERVLRGWHRYETESGNPPVVDFDCAPASAPAALGRLAAHRRLRTLLTRGRQAGDRRLVRETEAHLTYLAALLGECPPLDSYVCRTQGCDARGWPADYITARGEAARRLLAEAGVAWGPHTEHDLSRTEGVISAEEAAEAIRHEAAVFEPRVRAAVGTTAAYDLTVETVRADAYWSYWLDGAGRTVRLRVNLKRAAFTIVQARMFALHEVLGHGLQSAGFHAAFVRDEFPWLPLLTVHSPCQVALEGLAQALPLFVAADDRPLMTRVRLEHYLQLVRAELHLAINAGVSVDACAAHAVARVPFWDDAEIADLLADRGRDPLLRSYLWAYPAGLDWFAALAEAPPATAAGVLRAAYSRPLHPADLTDLWPEGPAIGGPGGRTAPTLEPRFLA
ncbi:MULTISPECIES: hypothetical protein [unclassified Streptomyces]|uniref:hypothetical protein n=1 Tax=unclassified Streptomyces TaxID=2593676 RepID=UPI0033C86CF3